MKKITAIAALAFIFTACGSETPNESRVSWDNSTPEQRAETCEIYTMFNEDFFEEVAREQSPEAAADIMEILEEEC